MSTPVNGSGGNYINQWAEVVYTPRTDAISLPDDVPVTGQWAEALTIPASPAPEIPQKTTWSDEVKLPNAEGPKPKASNWSDSYEVVMPDPWKDRPRQGIPWEQMGELFPVSRPNNDIVSQGGGGGGDGGDGGGGDPLALDLNHDGKIGVTGLSSAKVRDFKNAFVPEGSVVFDLLGHGQTGRYEWLNGDGDGFLVDDRDGKVSKAAKGDGVISGIQLFGNAGGYAHGFHKLAVNFDRDVKLASAGKKLPPGFGVLKGDELKGLKVWIDSNRDAKVQANELKTLAQLGISEIGSDFDMIKNKDGELLMQSHYFVQHGKKHLSEDVWFAQDPRELDRAGFEKE